MIRSLASKFYNSAVINAVDLCFPPREAGSIKQGFEIWRLYCDVEDIGLEDYLRDKDGISDFEDPEILYKLPKIADKLLTTQLEELVKAYLGKKARLDYACFSRISGKANGISSGHWHHDSVGRRLKAFLLLTDNTTQPVVSTEYVPNSNRMRINYTNDLANGRRLDPQSFDLGSAKRLTGKAGDLIIFDTNGVHRGLYEKQLGFRDTIQLEFSNRVKSRFIRGDIGPRLSKFSKILETNPLIDTKSLSKCQDFITYDKSIRF